MYDRDGLIVKQAAYSTCGIGADVWREAVPPAIRQVVDQRRVAKMVFAAPVIAVLLDRIPTVRAEQHDAATRFERTHHFSGGETVVGDVFDHLVRENSIKPTRGIGQVFRRGNQRVRRSLLGDLHALEFDVEGFDVE